MTRPFKLSKLGNVSDRETGQHLGYVVTCYNGGFTAVFSHLVNTDDPDSEEGTTTWGKHIAEVGRPAHTERFSKRLDAAEFLWETRDWDRKSFPPPPFEEPYKPEGVDGWIASPDVQGHWNRAMGRVKPCFERVEVDGAERWAAYGRAVDLTPGTSVQVQKRNGELSTVALEDDILSTETLFGVPIVTVLIKKSPRRSSGGSRRSGRSSMYGRYDCPRCGEDRGGMWNGYRCDECGYRR